MVDKKGGVSPAIVVLGVVVLLVIVAVVLSYDTSSITLPSFEGQKFGDAISQPQLNFFSYIVGKIPQFLIDATSGISATIVISAIFLILVFTFSDILSVFGTFSSDKIAWFIGVTLAIIAANLKWIMAVVVFGFSIASGLGVLAVVVGVAAPFLIFLGLHFLLLGNLKDWVRGKKTASEFKKGTEDLELGVEGIKAFGQAVKRKPGSD